MKVFILVITAVFVTPKGKPEIDTIATKIFSTLEECEEVGVRTTPSNNSAIILRKECRVSEVKE